MSDSKYRIMMVWPPHRFIETIPSTMSKPFIFTFNMAEKPDFEHLEYAVRESMTLRSCGGGIVLARKHSGRDPR